MANSYLFMCNPRHQYWTANNRFKDFINGNLISETWTRVKACKINDVAYIVKTSDDGKPAGIIAYGTVNRIWEQQKTKPNKNGNFGKVYKAEIVFSQTFNYTNYINVTQLTSDPNLTGQRWTNQSPCIKVQPSVAPFLKAKFSGSAIPNPITGANNNNSARQYVDKHPLNLILYGPPGTGKTYNTVNEALDRIQPTWKTDFENQKNNQNGITEIRDYALQLFNKYKEDGQIAFTTFHQSLSYEEFIEGIKPIPPKEQEESLKIEMLHTGNTGSQNPFGDGKTMIEGLDLMTYEVKPGIFKLLCKNASLNFSNSISGNRKSQIDFTKTRIFKMSLGQAGSTQANDIFNYCLENNCLALGWGDDIDFSNCNTRDDFKKKDASWGSTAVEIFKLWMRKNDIVLISNGTKYVKAIAQIEGEYEYDADGYQDIHQFRKVKWLYIGDDIPIKHLYDKNLSQQTIYGFYFKNQEGKDSYNRGINTQKLNEIITANDSPRETQPYVLIIDEINRGNVSQIFGELITLIEEEKRTTKWDENNKQYVDNPEKITVTLPYSQADFGVPGNLYIIGTMNTADRSVEALDTALRRRFEFKEMMPDSHIKNENGDDLFYKREICGIKLGELMDTINNRIRVLKDREHQIGHSYFMNCNTEPELKNTFKNKIVPLLQEYFYGNYAYIGLVLGKGFVKIDEKATEVQFADFDIDETPEKDKKYSLLTEDDWEKLNMEEALQNLINTSQNK